MLVSEKHKFIYIAPGKTGTTSIKNLLGKKFDAVIWEKWPMHVKSSTLRHVMHVPKKFKDYFIFATVRNPYMHEISRFLHSVAWGPLKKPARDDFQKTMNQSMMNTKMTTFKNLMNQHKGYKPIKGCVKFKIDYYVKLENLEEDFNDLPFVNKKVKIRHYNESPGRSNIRIFKNEWRERIYKRRKIDFEELGYPEEPPKELACLPGRWML